LFGASGILGQVWAQCLSSISDRVFLVGLGISKDPNLEKLVSKMPNKFQIVELDLTNTDMFEIFNDMKNLKFKFAVFNAAVDHVPSNDEKEKVLTDFEWTTWEKFIASNCKIFINSLNFFVENREEISYGVVIGSLYASVIPRQSNYLDENGNQVFIKHPGYSASKNAIKAIMKQYAAAYAQSGMVLNMLSPGVVNNNQPEWFVNNIKSNIPSGNLIAKEELKFALEFLLSEGAKHIVGHDLVIDGGYSLW
jgi:NAD(P)-dependent dehydrogenase (short-subunit alcohol dehydrogenase family)